MAAHPAPDPPSGVESGATPVLVGYDGSRQAGNAIQVGAQLLPGRRARLVHLWGPPYFDSEFRKRLWPPSGDMEEFAAAVEHEGRAEAERLIAQGKVLAEAAGWDTDVLLHRCYGDAGFELARLAGQEQPVAVVVGSRGLSGVRALLGSASDGLVHYSSAPVLVVPYPQLDTERQAALSGPVLVASDGSEGAAGALAAARALFASRDIQLAAVGFEPGQAGLDQPDVVVLKPTGVLSSGRAVAEALADHAHEIGAAVIAVGSRGRAAHRELLLGSVAMAVLHHAHRPVLVVPQAAADSVST